MRAFRQIGRKPKWRLPRALILGILLASLLVAPHVGCDQLATGLDASAGASGLDDVGFDDLPPEAQTTLHLIDSGGPFPYDKDGSVFHNYEGLLPAEADGYYREYTVETPGASNRGARRIVAGADGERYYTDNHYESFRLIVE